jgi:hypothetical protein
MLGALCFAITANTCAQLTKLSRIGALPCHECCSDITDGSTINIQCNTAGHGRNVLFLQACSSTCVTGHRTLMAGLDARIICSRLHQRTLLQKNKTKDAISMNFFKYIFMKNGMNTASLVWQLLFPRLLVALNKARF